MNSKFTMFSTDSFNQVLFPLQLYEIHPCFEPTLYNAVVLFALLLSFWFLSFPFRKWDQKIRTLPTLKTTARMELSWIESSLGKGRGFRWLITLKSHCPFRLTRVKHTTTYAGSFGVNQEVLCAVIWIFSLSLWMPYSWSHKNSHKFIAVFGTDPRSHFSVMRLPA